MNQCKVNLLYLISLVQLGNSDLGEGDGRSGKRGTARTRGFRCGLREKKKHAVDGAGAAEPAEGVRPDGPALRPDARQPPAHPPRRPCKDARERPSLPTSTAQSQHGHLVNPKPCSSSSRVLLIYLLSSVSPLVRSTVPAPHALSTSPLAAASTGSRFASPAIAPHFVQLNYFANHALL